LFGVYRRPICGLPTHDMITDIIIFVWGVVVQAIAGVLSLIPDPISDIPMTAITEFFTWLRTAIAPLNGAFPVSESCTVILLSITVVLPVILAIKAIRLLANR